MDFSDDTASSFFKAVLSSVASPAPLDVVIIYLDEEFGGSRPCMLCAPGPVCYSHYGPSTEMETGIDDIPSHFLLNHQLQFSVFRKMHSVRGFRLVFCVDVSDCMMPHALRELRNALQKEEGRGGFEYLRCEPFVTCGRRVLRTRPRDRVLGPLIVSTPGSAL